VLSNFSGAVRLAISRQHRLLAVAVPVIRMHQAEPGLFEDIIARVAEKVLDGAVDFEDATVAG
jgi:hypothetical protein